MLRTSVFSCNTLTLRQEHADLSSTGRDVESLAASHMPLLKRVLPMIYRGPHSDPRHAEQLSEDPLL